MRCYRHVHTMQTYKKYYWKTGILGMLMLLAVLFPGPTSAQQVVVMPHNGTDTLTVNRQNCYTIMDPGGYSNYTNNEDSWLLIHSTSGTFSLKMEYETGINGDCNDYIDIFYGSDSNAWSQRYCATGSALVHSGSDDMLIRFHSNNYASFRGFEIQVYYPNSINNWNYHAVNDSTVTLTWDDDLT